MIEINKIKYPDLNGIQRQHRNPRSILRHEIFWQEKRDGSNIGAYLTDDNKVLLQSRNMDVASQSFHNAFVETEGAEKIREFLTIQRDRYNNDCVVYGEMLSKGKSPTRIEFHEKPEFVVFDIWSSKLGGFKSYVSVRQHCYQFDIPIVNLYGVSSHRTIGSLYGFRDVMLEKAKANGREGVVGKIYEKNTMYLYFKEKNDTPRLERKPRSTEDHTVILPPLPESEIWGALDKVLVDIGEERFLDVGIAMPLFARYVSIECKKHICAKPKKNLFAYYKEKLEDM